MKLEFVCAMGMDTSSSFHLPGQFNHKLTIKNSVFPANLRSERHWKNGTIKIFHYHPNTRELHRQHQDIFRHSFKSMNFCCALLKSPVSLLEHEANMFSWYSLCEDTVDSSESVKGFRLSEGSYINIRSRV